MDDKRRIQILEDLLKHATDVIDSLAYESDGKYFTAIDEGSDVTEDVKYVFQKTDEYFSGKI